MPIPQTPPPHPEIGHAPTLAQLIAIATAAEAMPPRKLYFSFAGRISRRTFWLDGILTLSLLALLGNALLQIAGLEAETSGGLMNFGLAWPFLAVSAKRWHDQDCSGWWTLINLIPGIGLLATLIGNGFVRGTPGPNRFGPDSVHLAGRDALNTAH